MWLFRGPQRADRAIRGLTNAPVNHVGMAIVIDDLPPLMWHAELGPVAARPVVGPHQRGVQLHDLRDAVLQWGHRYGQRGWLRQLDGPVDRAMEDAALRTVARLDGTPFPSTARLAGRWLRGRLPGCWPWRRGADPAGRPEAVLETAYCAEVVAVTYEEMGLLPPGQPPELLRPRPLLERRRPRAGRRLPARRRDRGGAPAAVRIDAAVATDKWPPRSSNSTSGSSIPHVRREHPGGLCVEWEPRATRNAPTMDQCRVVCRSRRRCRISSPASVRNRRTTFSSAEAVRREHPIHAPSERAEVGQAHGRCTVAVVQRDPAPVVLVPDTMHVTCPFQPIDDRGGGAGREPEVLTEPAGCERYAGAGRPASRRAVRSGRSGACGDCSANTCPRRSPRAHTPATAAPDHHEFRGPPLREATPAGDLLRLLNTRSMRGRIDNESPTNVRRVSPGMRRDPPRRPRSR